LGIEGNQPVKLKKFPEHWIPLHTSSFIELLIHIKSQKKRKASVNAVLHSAVVLLGNNDYYGKVCENVMEVFRRHSVISLLARSVDLNK